MSQSTGRGRTAPTTERRIVQTIWKYPLALNDEQTITVPSGATPLHVGPDPLGGFALWMLVDDLMPKTDRRIIIRGTGFPVPAHKTYIGSLHDGPFMWHVMEGF